jgi:protein-S-isoprenylcysteine O-methyltransferase Ste14
MLQIAIGAGIALMIVYISWPSLRDVRAHGFYRFFALQAILGLVLVNLPAWFQDPFSAGQVISWLLLAVSLGLVIHAARLLRTAGRPSGGVESTTVLVKQGAYRYIRHPLYSSLLFLAWGAFLKNITLPSTLLVLVASLSLAATASVEEAENLRKFGADYAAYQQSTRRFIPFVF